MKRLICSIVALLLSSDDYYVSYYVLVQMSSGQTYEEYCPAPYLDSFVREFVKNDDLVILNISKYVFESNTY